MDLNIWQKKTPDVRKLVNAVLHFIRMWPDSPHSHSRAGPYRWQVRSSQYSKPSKTGTTWLEQRVLMGSWAGPVRYHKPLIWWILWKKDFWLLTYSLSNPSPIYDFPFFTRENYTKEKNTRTYLSSLVYEVFTCSQTITWLECSIYFFVFDMHGSEKEIIRLLREGNADQKERESKQFSKNRKPRVTAGWPNETQSSGNQAAVRFALKPTFDQDEVHRQLNPTNNLNNSTVTTS